MKNFNFVKIALLSLVVFVTAGALSVNGQRRERTRTWNGGQTIERRTTLWSGQRSDRRWHRDADRRRRHNRETYGYRNYGQYRRTQVGNRRFRTVNRYSWLNGRRVTRRVRITY